MEKERIEEERSFKWEYGKTKNWRGKKALSEIMEKQRIEEETSEKIEKTTNWRGKL